MPKLIVLDMDTGAVLNDQLRLGIIEYIHEFCDKQVSLAEPNKKNDDFNFIFDFDIDDFCMYDKHANAEGKVKLKKRLPKDKKSKKRLDSDLLLQLRENRVKLSAKTSSNEIHLTCAHMKIYYLLYFCSDFTTSNTSLFENVIKFLIFMKEKFECSIKIILISSDSHEKDYQKLIAKFRLGDLTSSDEMSRSDEDYDKQNLSLTYDFERYALHFNAKAVKEKLFQQMNVVGIPWFSLINGNTGEIMCENLKIFILNSQLRDMIF